MINGTFLIKRRETGGSGPPASLSAGQFAFNKVDETLYVGTTGGSVPIGGSGAFVNKTLLQNLSANWQEAYTNLIANSAAYIALDAFVLNNTLSGAVPQYGHNKIEGDLGLIGSGVNNVILQTGDYSAILGGQTNLITHPNCFVLGSGLSSHSANFTYVNNISGTFWGQGINLYGSTITLGTSSFQFATTAFVQEALASGTATASVLVAQVVNADTVTLTRGMVVYAFGAQGDRVSVKRASAGGDPTSSKTLGLINDTIAVGGTGYVTLNGTMNKLSLGSPYVEGDALWLGTVPGTYTRVKPVAPIHSVFIGIVERANAGNGTAYIKVQNGYELEEIHDVLIVDPQASQILQRNESNTLWVNKNPSFTTSAFTDSKYLPLSGGTVTGSVQFNDDVTIYGNLSCSGTQTFANTIFATTSALSVVHVGSGPALWVGNNGTGDIASFYDIDQNVEVLHVGGANSIFPNVGIKTSFPNKDFTVKGEISATGTIFDNAGNSVDWNSVYSTVSSTSANWSAVYADFKRLSSTFLTSETDSQTISFVDSTKELTISNGNTISLSALVDSSLDTGVRSLTSDWNSTYSTVQFNSGSWSSVYSTIQSNSATYVTLTGTQTLTNKTVVDWMTLVRGYKTTPTLNTTIATGEVWNYVFDSSPSDKTYYRFIATDGSEDAFYGTFANPTLSNLIATKKIIL